jgi:hypothetical protein
MKSDLELMLLPNSATEIDDEHDFHNCDVLCKYEHDRKWHTHSMLEVIVASVWSQHREWNYSIMMARRPLTYINGRPC